MRNAFAATWSGPESDSPDTDRFDQGKRMVYEGLRMAKNPPAVVGNRSDFAEKASGELRLAMGLELILGICKLLEHAKATSGCAADRLRAGQTF
jgi:hypothetical protein